MEKTIELIDKLVMTKEELCEGVGISTTLLHKFEKGRYTGKNLRKRMAAFARQQAEAIIEKAIEVEAEAA
jgi:DNA-binding XRE family transcriptional regulator